MVQSPENKGIAVTAAAELSQYVGFVQFCSWSQSRLVLPQANYALVVALRTERSKNGRVARWWRAAVHNSSQRRTFNCHLLHPCWSLGTGLVPREGLQLLSRRQSPLWGPLQCPSSAEEVRETLFCPSLNEKRKENKMPPGTRNWSTNSVSKWYFKMSLAYLASNISEVFLLVRSWKEIHGLLGTD